MTQLIEQLVEQEKKLDMAVRETMKLGGKIFDDIQKLKNSPVDESKISQYTEMLAELIKTYEKLRSSQLQIRQTIAELQKGTVDPTPHSNKQLVELGSNPQVSPLMVTSYNVLPVGDNRKILPSERRATQAAIGTKAK